MSDSGYHRLNQISITYGKLEREGPKVSRARARVVGSVRLDYPKLLEDERSAGG